MGCKGCDKEQEEDMVAKKCPKCGRRFIGSAEVCGYCAAKDKANAKLAKEAEIE